MPPKTRKSSPFLAERIREQRLALGLTIERAAKLAGVGTKTWSRYESGQPIRTDKVWGICRALKWPALPTEDDYYSFEKSDAQLFFEINNESHEAWSKVLDEEYGRFTAIFFAAGSDLALSYITEDLDSLRTMPRGAHIGELPFSMLEDKLPRRYLTRYDYEFLFKLRAALLDYRLRAKQGEDMEVHTVADELLVNMICDLGYVCCDSAGLLQGEYAEEIEETCEEWLERFCGDDDLHLFLYNDYWLMEIEAYQFENWFTPQFYLSRPNVVVGQ